MRNFENLTNFRYNGEIRYTLNFTYKIVVYSNLNRYTEVSLSSGFVMERVYCTYFFLLRGRGVSLFLFFFFYRHAA